MAEHFSAEHSRWNSRAERFSIKRSNWDHHGGTLSAETSRWKLLDWTFAMEHCKWNSSRSNLPNGISPITLSDGISLFGRYWQNLFGGTISLEHSR